MRSDLIPHLPCHARFLAAALVLTAVTASSQADDWPRWRGPHLNGISRETTWDPQRLTEGPKVLWRASVGTGFSSVSVANGKVYTLGNDAKKDTVFCFDAATGAVVWKHTYDAPLDPKYYEGGPSATPTVDGDKVYTISKQAMLFCLDAATGKVVWSKNIAQELGAKTPTWGFAGSVLVEGDLLLLNVGTAGAALSKQDGKVVWKSGTDEAGYSTPVPFDAAGKRMIALFLAKSVAAVELATGKPAWSYPWETSYDVNAADPILAGNEVFISSGYNRGATLIDVSSNPPRKVWENKNMRNHMNSCVLIGGHLYGFDENELKCVDWKTGAVKWSEKGPGKGALSAANDKLIVQGEKGELVIAEASPAGFKPIARGQVFGGKSWTTPVLANGRIYCRNAKGDLVCVDVSPK